MRTKSRREANHGRDKKLPKTNRIQCRGKNKKVIKEREGRKVEVRRERRVEEGKRRCWGRSGCSREFVVGGVCPPSASSDLFDSQSNCFLIQEPQCSLIVNNLMSHDHNLPFMVCFSTI